MAVLTIIKITSNRYIFINFNQVLALGEQITENIMQYAIHKRGCSQRHKLQYYYFVNCETASRSVVPQRFFEYMQEVLSA